MIFPNTEDPFYYNNIKTMTSPEPKFPSELIKWRHNDIYSDFIYLYSFDIQNIRGFLFATDKENNVYRASKLHLNSHNNIICQNWKLIKPTEIQKWLDVFHRQYNHFRLKQKQTIVQSKIEKLSTDFK